MRLSSFLLGSGRQILQKGAGREKLEGGQLWWEEGGGGRSPEPSRWAQTQVAAWEVRERVFRGDVLGSVVLASGPSLPPTAPWADGLIALGISFLIHKKGDNRPNSRVKPDYGC